MITAGRYAVKEVRRRGCRRELGKAVAHSLERTVAIIGQTGVIRCCTSTILIHFFILTNSGRCPCITFHGVDKTMRWRRGRRSTNVEDRRRSGHPRRVPRRLKFGGGFGLLVVVVVLILGGDPTQVLRLLSGGGPVAPQAETRPATRADAPIDEGARFVSVVLADTEDTWNALFRSYGKRYQPATLVLYTDYVQSACGFGSAATGPFYCPADQKVYIDLGFFRRLREFGAPGDFAQAYVIGHEIAHHVQNLLGTAGQVRQLQARVSKSEANALSVLAELQADCYAGVWAHHAHKQRNILEPGDAEEGLRAAASVGDDRMQEMAGQSVQPESFTHGSSQQRAHWFHTGLNLGKLEACDTFAQAHR